MPVPEREEVQEVVLWTRVVNAVKKVGESRQF
jgi:hypothetical protein